jgi:CHAT domain-containing protein/tetratricopeptide (TPR) repeat protein
MGSIHRRAPRAAAAVVGLALAMIAPPRTSAQDANDPVDALWAQIDEHRLRGAHAEAAGAAGEILAILEADPDAKPHEVAEARRVVETLEHVAGLAADERRAFARADSLEMEHWALWDEGRYAESAALIERELELRRRLLGGSHPEVAATINNLALALAEQGDYARAELLHREALAIRRDVLGEDDPVVAESLNGLAAVLRSAGEFAEAEELSREALAIHRRALGDEHRDVALSLSHLAHFLYTQGDYAGAEPLFREALAIQRKVFGGDHIEVAAGLNNLATLLKVQGDYAEAEPLYREALAAVRNVLGDEHPYVATSLNNLAYLLKAKGDYAEAEPLFHEAIAMKRKLLGEEHPSVATSLHNLAALLRAKGDYEEAEQVFHEALAMRRKFLGDEHPDTAGTLHHLAGVLRAQGDYAGAEPHCREAVAAWRALLGDEHPHVASGLGLLAGILRGQGDYAGAEELLVEAARVHDAARLRAGTGVKRATFQSSPYPYLAATRLALGRTEDAWPAAEKALAQSLADLLMAAAERDLSPREWAREDSLRGVLGELEHALAAYRKAARTDTSAEASDRADEARAALLAAEAEWSVFQSEMAAKYTVTEGQAYPLARVQASLSEDTAIVGWLDVELGVETRESWGYAVRSSGPVEWVELPAAAAGGAAPAGPARAFRTDLADAYSSQAAVDREARRVWAQRVEPLVAALDGIEHLIVLPSGAMLGVPIEALIDDRGRSVADRFAVSYAPSATIHAWLHEGSGATAEAGRERRTLLVGDPPFTEAHLAAMALEEDEEEPVLLASLDPMPEASLLRSALTGNRDALASLPRLPGARVEVRSLREICPDPMVLAGADASEQEIQSLIDSDKLADFGTVHLATHALVDDERPERSALILSQVDLPDPLEAAAAGAPIYDGLATAAEIVRDWRLDADLVTLSACETGLGKEVGGEGYIGFAHAFLQAGARSLLVSLWKVADEPTTLLMRRFYENHIGKCLDDPTRRPAEPMPKAEALREAKRWLRDYEDEPGDRPYAHPYYWSSFILIGDPL